MVDLIDNELVFSFPEVHPEAVCRISFQRTLRVPDDGGTYPLPAGLGRFPMEHVEDHEQTVPKEWTEHGGVVLPMCQAEAMWIRFSGLDRYPFAVKVAAGKVNAVTGSPWVNALQRDPQDYLVVPKQRWLDGFCVAPGQVRQFVAMPLGAGFSAEEQLTARAAHGGLQLAVYPMVAERYETLKAQRWSVDDGVRFSVCEPAMGLAPGGLLKQQIFADEEVPASWCRLGGRCFVHLLNSEEWVKTTGQPVPTSPIGAADYNSRGIPWFKYYGEGPILSGADMLASLDSTGVKASKLPGSNGMRVVDGRYVMANGVIHLTAHRSVLDRADATGGAG